MTIITTTAELKNAILQLESRQATQAQLLKEQFGIVYRSLKPFNIIKNVIGDAVGSHGLQNGIVGIAGDLAGSFISKKITGSGSEGIMKKILKTILNVGISTVVSRNAGSIISLGGSVFKMFRRNKKTENDLPVG
jgi:hypothetical protein